MSINKVANTDDVQNESSLLGIEGDFYHNLPEGYIEDTSPDVSTSYGASGLKLNASTTSGSTGYVYSINDKHLGPKMRWPGIGKAKTTIVFGAPDSTYDDDVLIGSFAKDGNVFQSDGSVNNAFGVWLDLKRKKFSTTGNQVSSNIPLGTNDAFIMQIISDYEAVKTTFNIRSTGYYETKTLDEIAYNSRKGVPIGVRSNGNGNTAYLLYHRINFGGML